MHKGIEPSNLPLSFFSNAAVSSAESVPPFPESRERLLHRLVIALADVDPALSLGVERQDLFFHVTEGGFGSDLGKSS